MSTFGGQPGGEQWHPAAGGDSPAGGGAPPGGPGGPGTTPGQEPGLPWENRDQLGFIAAVWGTIKGVLLEPQTAFRSMQKTGGLGAPLGYGVLLGSFGGAMGIIWQLLFGALTSTVGTSGSPKLEELLGGAIGLAVVVVMMPLFVIIGLFISAAITHLFALIFGAGKNGFEVTMRVICYAQGSTAVLNAIPIFGGFAAGIWSLIATIMGLAEAQQTTGGRAAAAVLVPIAVLCCLCGLVVVIAIAAAGAAGSGM